MVIGTIAVNFGEAIFFASGGMGLFMWAVIGFAGSDWRGRGSIGFGEPAGRILLMRGDPCFQRLRPNR